MQSLSATHPTWVQASQAYSRGDLATAARLYRQLVTQEPQHIEALYRLGCIAYTQGRPALARIYLGQAAALPPLPPSIVPWAMWHGRLATSRLPRRSISRLCSLIRKQTRCRRAWGMSSNCKASSKQRWPAINRCCTVIPPQRECSPTWAWLYRDKVRSRRP